MLSKAKIKYIKSLQTKKYRKEEESFIIQGAKSVLELLGSDLKVKMLVASSTFIDANRDKLHSVASVIEAKPQEIASISTFVSNDQVIAVALQPKQTKVPLSPSELVLALDDIRDPGNLGTMVRLADWYGISTVLCSTSCVDFYNPKVINATMGSFTRVRPYYTNLEDDLSEYSGAVYGAFMGGDDVHALSLEPKGVLIIGNESNGINKALERLVSQKIAIKGRGNAESLNAAIASAILIDNFYR